MSATKTADGSAFPTAPKRLSGSGKIDPEWNPGMTLRDYFAAAALHTMKLANSWSDNPLYWEGVAKSAYVCADAMLAARVGAMAQPIALKTAAGTATVRFANGREFSTNCVEFVPIS